MNLLKVDYSTRGSSWQSKKKRPCTQLRGSDPTTGCVEIIFYSLTRGVQFIFYSLTRGVQFEPLDMWSAVSALFFTASPVGSNWTSRHVKRGLLAQYPKCAGPCPHILPPRRVSSWQGVANFSMPLAPSTGNCAGVLWPNTCNSCRGKGLWDRLKLSNWVTPGANAVQACRDTVIEPVWNNNQSGEAWSGRGRESNSAHDSSNVSVHVLFVYKSTACTWNSLTRKRTS